MVPTKHEALPSSSPSPSPLVIGATMGLQYHQNQIPLLETFADVSSIGPRMMWIAHALLFSFLSVSSRLALVAGLRKAPLAEKHPHDTPTFLSGGDRASYSR